MPVARKLPYWRLSGFYFFYFSALGAFLPYWALYLQAEGYTPAQIGQLMALLAGTKLISPNLWGWLADRSGRGMPLIRMASCLTVVGFGMVFWLSGFRWLALITFAFGFFWNAPLPLFEAVTLVHLGQDAHRYSRVRLWGSIGFIVAVLAVGKALDTFVVIDCLPILILILFIGMGLASLLVPERSIGVVGNGNGSLLKILSQPRVVAFLVVFMLIQIAHGPYYVFFSIYLKANGFDSSSTGQLWALGVLAEIVLFVFLHRLLQRSSLRGILLVSIGLGVLRWLIIAWFVQELVLVAFAQVLHAATFGASHVAAIHLVHRYFAGPHHGKGQALYSSLSYGLGGMLGSYYSGALWDSQGPVWIYSAAAGVSLLALLIVWGWVDKQPGERRTGARILTVSVRRP
ncbi:MAG TPA: MFS transporter [Methylococcaceae bacterium]|jgi:PPP family 3-phenylpropionic acid transporter|nr:MFS transporter [Methylococcaceae bacterium]